MAKTKSITEKKEITIYEPGKPIKVECIGCRESITMVPSAKTIMPADLKLVCSACGGLRTKWKNAEEKAINVEELEKNQMKLSV